MPGERLHGFFASLTIYELPLHVIYTGLMVMPFRAETLRRGDPLGRWGGEGMCECVKYCTETPPAAADTARGEREEECGGASWEQLCRDEDTRQAAARAGTVTI